RRRDTAMLSPPSQVDVLQGIRGAPVLVRRGVDVAGGPREIAAREPGECDVARGTERRERLLRRVDPRGRRFERSFGCERARDDQLRVPELVAEVGAPFE